MKILPLTAFLMLSRCKTIVNDYFKMFNTEGFVTELFRISKCRREWNFHCLMNGLDE